MSSRNVLIAMVLVVVGGLAFADALPDQSTLVITDGSGTPIGSGTYVGGDLSVGVVSDGTAQSYDGATLTLTTRGGDTLTYTVNVSVDADGNVTITLADSGKALESINPSILARGGTVDYSTMDAYVAPTLPPPGPNPHANANAFQHAGNAADGMGNAAEAAITGSGHANDRAGAGDHNAER